MPTFLKFDVRLNINSICFEDTVILGHHNTEMSGIDLVPEVNSTDKEHCYVPKADIKRHSFGVCTPSLIALATNLFRVMFRMRSKSPSM